MLWRLAKYKYYLSDRQKDEAGKLKLLKDGIEAAKKAVCSSNLRQIGMAWEMYNADHDDTLMRVRTVSGNAKVTMEDQGDCRVTLSTLRGAVLCDVRSRHSRFTDFLRQTNREGWQARGGAGAQRVIASAPGPDRGKRRSNLRPGPL